MAEEVPRSGRSSNEESLRDIWILHRDNVPSHTTLIVSNFFTKMGVATLPHPPYNPNLAPVSSQRNLKRTQQGTLELAQMAHFLPDEDVVDSSTWSLTLPQQLPAG
ncbi:hypothetical protein TNCV_2205841 [Trichonephila clavipes]|nr:hypothetical protein TNCV_2205841 [Trichonephila clavipes]